MIKGTGGRTNIEIPEGPGNAMHFFAELEGNNINVFDRTMLNNCFGIICGDFCGKCLHKCPSKELVEKEMKDFDLSKRYSAVSRAV
jgi:hypothetical protein